MKRIIALFSFLILIITGCDAITTSDDLSRSTESQNGNGKTNVVKLENGQPVENYRVDPYEIISTIIEGDSFSVSLRYNGGCKEHEFSLVAYSFFMESYPVQANLILTHNANGDACEALVYENLTFGLFPLKQEYLSQYSNESDPIILNVLVDKGTNNILRFTYYSQTLYTNSFETTEDATGWTGIEYEMFVDDHAPGCGVKSLYIGGGCLQPTAGRRITIADDGYYSISCWGKTNTNGGNVKLVNGEAEEISIHISAEEWTRYTSEETLYCEAGESIQLEFWVGGIVFDDLFCDDLIITKLN